MTRIFLVGYMGAGKTTLGRAFAKAMNLSFIDQDWYIEERFHKSVSTLFQEKGEEAFRELERQMLHEIAAFEDVIISTGGGTPCFFDNMDFMNQQGDTVFLNASQEVLFRRLKVASHSRPILQGKKEDELKLFIADALEKRLPFYQQSKYTFKADGLENHYQIEQSVENLRELLKL